MRVHLCGVRGSTPAPGLEFLRYGGHTSCVAIAHGAQARVSLILDAGTGVRSVTKLLGGEAFKGTILLTHLHWDHVQGLPFFTAGDNDDAHVELMLPEQQDDAGAEAVLERAMSPPHFPMSPKEMRGSWAFATLAEGEIEVEGFKVLAREIPHKGGRTFGYRVSDGRATFTYMPDHCPTELGAGDDGWGVCHATALELAQDSDALVHDAHLLNARELASEGRFGHAAADYAVQLGARAGARQTLLFHHRPDRTDAQLDELAARFGPDDEVRVAAQDTILEL